MFNRIDEIFVITTDNLAALEAITEWIYRKLQITYFIQVELFPNMTIYRICMKVRSDWDNKISKNILEDLKLRNIEIMKGQS